jgi:geranylgeranyl reductase family protein
VLARAGLEVALIDRARFPRDKLCGGLLSQRSLNTLCRVFGPDCAVPIEASSTGAAVFLKDAPLARVVHGRAMHFTSRRRFDAHLVDLAAARGASVFEGVAVTSLDCDGHAVVALADGRALTATFVIGADGAASRVRKQLGVPIDRRGFAVGLEAEVPRIAVRRDVRDPEIYFGVCEWGYGWVFPKRDTLTVGVGGLAAANADMRAAFREFARLAIGGVPAQPVCGSPIPFGNFVARPGRGAVLLAGDAAGLVEPLTGEGIAFAVESGFQAAQAVLEAAGSGTPARALQCYAAGYRRIVDAFTDVALLRRLVFSRYTRRMFLRALARNDRLVLKHMDVLAGDAEYRDYARFALVETLLRLPQLLGEHLRGQRAVN